METQGKADMLGPIVNKAGKGNLIAAAVLVVGWFLFTALSVQLPLIGAAKFTFWQVLGFLNAGSIADAMGSGGASAGIYGLLAFVALAGPFVPVFWKDKRAGLCGVAPLLFMLIVFMMVGHGIDSVLGGGADNEFTKQARSELMSGVSLGLGAYVCALAGIYFAVMGVKQFLETRTSGVLPASSRAVA